MRGGAGKPVALQQDCGGKIHDARRDGVDGGAVAAIPCGDGQLNHQVHQLLLQVDKLGGQRCGQIVGQSVLPPDLQHQPGRRGVLFGEDGRRSRRGHDAVGAGSCCVDHLALQRQEPAPGAHPGLPKQRGAGAERVVQRAVGQSDGLTDRPDGRRGRTRCHDERLDGVEHDVGVVDAGPGHGLTVTEQLLFYPRGAVDVW